MEVNVVRQNLQALIEPGVNRNPFTNHVVVRTLFEVAEFDEDDFRNFRLVSRMWAQESLSIWRRKVGILIAFTTDRLGIFFPTYRRLYANNTFQLKTHPFRKVVIHQWEMLLHNRECGALLKFWKTIGPTLHHLEITDCYFDRARDLRKVIFELTPNLFHLALQLNTYGTFRPSFTERRLELTMPHNQWPRSVQNNLRELIIIISTTDLPITWMELLLHFPNIELLAPIQTKKSRITTASAEVQELFASMDIIRREHGLKYFSKLNRLHLYDAENTVDRQAINKLHEFPPDAVPFLARLQLPLKELHLNIGLRTQEETFRRILAPHESSLKTLLICRNDDAPPFVNFPIRVQFQNLTCLKMEYAVVHNISFLKQVPNLETLQCTINSSIWNENLEDFAGLTLTNLKELLLECVRILSTNQVTILGKIMPNVSSATICTESSGFREVCSAWKNLKCLIIELTQINEECFLGTDEGVMFRHPNITDLKDLKRIEMYDCTPGTTGGTTTLSLTRNCVIHGIFSLKKLEGGRFSLDSEAAELKDELIRRLPGVDVFV